MKSVPYIPFYGMTAALFLLSVMDALIKYVSSEHNTWQIVVLRYSIGLIVSITIYIWRFAAKPATISSNNILTRKALYTSFIRSLFVLMTASSFFYAVSELPLDQVIPITFTAPLFMVFFSYILLGEPISRIALLAILLGFSGVLVIFHDALSSNIHPFITPPMLPLSAAIFASVFYALSIVLARKHSSHTSALDMVVLQTLFALLLALPFGLAPHEQANWASPTPVFWLLFITIGILGTSGHLLIIWCLRQETASKLGMLEYTTLIWAIVFGYILFDDTPTLYTLIGAALVIGGCFVVTRKEKES